MRARGGRDLAIATLIAAGRLDDSLLEAARSRLPDIGATVWRDGDDAAQVEVANSASARNAIEGWNGLDIVVRTDTAMPRLFIADMDSTMIGQECIDELGAVAGVGDQVASITERAMRGELDFEGSLRERLALLEGLPANTIDRLLDERIVPNPGAKTLVATLKANGVRCVLVSGGFHAFADVVGASLGFDLVVANRLGVIDGKLTGGVDGDIVDRATKARVLRQEMQRLGEGASLAIGDGANDLDMIEAATLGIAYRAKPAVAAVADARLDHHRLDALLWSLGISRADWA